MCGLGEGRFPATDGSDPLDLTLAHRQIGDVSPRERDKYLFLETVACAHDRLYFSYVDRDAQTGDALEPSSVVNELIRYLHGGREGSPLSWIDHQPLRRFDESYFTDSARTGQTEFVRSNASPAARSEHNARKLREALRDQAHDLSRLDAQGLRRMDSDLVRFLGLCPVEPLTRLDNKARRLSISIQSLRLFLECPLQGWARQMLRLPPEEEDDPAMCEDEPFVTSRVDQSVLLREAFLDSLNAGFSNAESANFESIYHRRAALRRFRGLLPIGLFGEVDEPPSV